MNKPDYQVSLVQKILKKTFTFFLSAFFVTVAVFGGVVLAYSTLRTNYGNGEVLTAADLNAITANVNEANNWIAHYQAGNWWPASGWSNYAASAGNSDTVDGLHASQLGGVSTDQLLNERWVKTSSGGVVGGNWIRYTTGQAIGNGCLENNCLYENYRSYFCFWNCYYGYSIQASGSGMGTKQICDGGNNCVCYCKQIT